MSTFFFGMEVKKYLLKNLFFFFCLGKLVSLISKSEFSKDIGICISELGFSGIGVGASMNGLRPIIEFMTFNFFII